MSDGPMRERFSDEGEALMDALRKRRVSHRTLVTVEGYVGKIERRNRKARADLAARLIAAVEALRDDASYAEEDTFISGYETAKYVVLAAIKEAEGE